MTTMETFEFGWYAELWLRNAAVLTLVAGGLHWWLYGRKAQGEDYKFSPSLARYRQRQIPLAQSGLGQYVLEFMFPALPLLLPSRL